jgi:hypothetical protein
MSANSPVTTPSPSIKVNHTYLAGRIATVRKWESTFFHTVILPAPDEFSHPQTVEISASSRLGDKDDDIRVMCRCGGSRNEFMSKDKETGELRKVVSANNKFFAVEAA